MKDIENNTKTAERSQRDGSTYVDVAARSCIAALLTSSFTGIPVATLAATGVITYTGLQIYNNKDEIYSAVELAGKCACWYASTVSSAYNAVSSYLAGPIALLEEEQPLSTELNNNDFVLVSKIDDTENSMNM